MPAATKSISSRGRAGRATSVLCAPRLLLARPRRPCGPGGAPQPGSVGGEGQVRVAAAQVDHPQRSLRRGAQAPARSRRRPPRQGAQELLDLAVLRLARRLDPPLRVGDAERDEQRVRPRASRRCFARSCARSAAPCARSPDCVCSSAWPFLVTRSWWVVVWSRRASWRTARRAARPRPPRGSSWLRGVGLRVVVRRDLQAPAGLQVDVPQLDAAPPRRLLAAAPTGGQGPDEVLVVEDAARSWSVPGRAAVTSAGAVSTTIRMSPPSATGMTMRR